MKEGDIVLWFGVDGKQPATKLPVMEVSRNWALLRDENNKVFWIQRQELGMMAKPAGAKRGRKPKVKE